MIASLSLYLIFCRQVSADHRHGGTGGVKAESAELELGHLEELTWGKKIAQSPKSIRTHTTTTLLDDMVVEGARNAAFLNEWSSQRAR